ncbi:MAG: shikimate dehydrogenase [Ruminococcaceae bacterium]|nr:shikimate dehydrogenase [Oscillospiraceae bacterium]
MKYGVIGEHLKHSFSKEIHAQIGDYQYEIKEIEPQNLEAFIKERDFLGINVTIPYKEKVIPMLDYVDPAALSIGAVNTVVNRDGKLYGYNTDYSGMKALSERIGLEIQGKKVLVVGTGGTSKTATRVLKDMGAKEIIYVSNIDIPGAFSYEEVYAYHTDCEIIFNTSPVGMYPKNDGIPLKLECFPELEGVLDVVYNPIRTNLVQKAHSLGKKAEGGLYMLGAQAVYASEHFMSSKLNKEICDKVYKNVLSGKDNIILVGMPSSGKTTVGKALSQKTGKAFVDTDDEIVKKIGMSIPEYFEKYGESEFRRIESEVIAEVSSGNNQIISTGGGAVLNPDNVRRLKQNGNVYFLDRDLEHLCPTGDRPLSSNMEAMKKRYEERYHIYCASCDVRVDGNGTVEEVANLIYEAWSK